MENKRFNKEQVKMIQKWFVSSIKKREMKYKIGQLLSLLDAKYKGIIGTVIIENKAWNLVRTNGS